MNLWMPQYDKWKEGFNPTCMPWYAKFDFVEVRDYVQPDDPESNESPFKFRWRDDFDTFDESKWLKIDNLRF